MTLVASITFLTPFGGLLALTAALPLAAWRRSRRRNARGLQILGLPAPESGRLGVLIALMAAPLLLGLAAAGPAIRTHVGRRVRTDAQAIFIFDTSRSMAAAASYQSPSRFAEAQAAAIQLRDDAIPEVPSGVASLTTELLPHLFPTPDVDAFNSTVEHALGVEKPPPPFLLYGVLGTSFGPLFELRSQGYFNPNAKHRLAILLTDGESGAIDASTIGQALNLPSGYPPAPLLQAPGLPIRRPQPPVSLFIIRVGSGADRIYKSDGSIEAAYRPEPTAADIVSSLAAASHGYVFTASHLAAAGVALRKALGSGRSTLQGANTKTVNLGAYIALAIIIPLGVIIWERNLRRI